MSKHHCGKSSIPIASAYPSRKHHIPYLSKEILLFNKHIFIVYHIPGSYVGTENTGVKQKETKICELI